MNWFRRAAFYTVFDADKGAGSGGGTGDGPGEKTGDQKLDENGNPIVEKKPDSNPDVKFTQADIDKAVADRLKREKDTNDKKTKEKQGEFENLYNEVKPKLETLTTENDDLKKQNAVYSGLIEKQIESQIKDWPKEVKDLYPSDASVETRLAWVEKSTALAKRLVTQKPPVSGQHGKQGEPGGLQQVENNQMGRYKAPVIPGMPVSK